MDCSHLPEYIRYLLEPANHFPVAGSVQLLQTHVSYIIIAGNIVYKWKKPVSFGFLDFSTLSKRKNFCEEEVRLNRRLCPEIYLGLVSITQETTGLQLDGCGECIEYGVKMKRLPEEQMMNRVVVAGTLNKKHLQKIVAILVPFYSLADGGGRVVKYGSSTAVRKTIHDNFAETARFVGSSALSSKRFANIQAFTDSFLQRDELFQQRINSGRIRECHGDLHSANICLTERVDIFDCIEFNESLRCTDVAADIAFLAMDLDFHGLHTLSDYFIHCFIEHSGDNELLRVLNFYKCYRAYVRGKIGLLTAADPGVTPDDASAALITAGKYFRLAEQYGAI